MNLFVWGANAIMYCKRYYRFCSITFLVPLVVVQPPFPHLTCLPLFVCVINIS